MDGQGNPQLEGRWINICKAGSEGPDAKLTSDDLDGIVRNYQSREKKAPIGVGRNWAGAKPYGQVDDVRRGDGDYLLAKLSNVDPRMEELHKAGAFKKKEVLLQKTPQGLSLERVGFLDDDQGSNVTSIDDVHKAEFRRHTLLYRENPLLGKVAEFVLDLPSSEAGSHVSNAASRLKAAGLWGPLFDKYQFASILGELERKNRNAANIFAEFLESIAPITQFSEGKSNCVVVDRGLNSEARSLLRRRDDLTYGQALDIVHQDRSQRARSAEFSEAASAGLCRGVELDQEARRVMRERSVSYSEALDKAAAEHPDLATR